MPYVCVCACVYVSVCVCVCVCVCACARTLRSRSMRDAKGTILQKHLLMPDPPGSPVVNNLPANAGDTSLIPGPARFHMLPGN